MSIESRGRDATGFAFRDEAETLYHKAPLTAGRFVQLGHHQSVPRSTDTVLIHTRAATQGDPKDNDNNHPIVVPRRDEHPGLVGIHNGMLWNDTQVWRDNPDLAAEKIGEVDSQLIFQLLSRRGRESLDLLDGDASIAWVDIDYPGELNLARMGGRPLAAALTKGGSLIFGSTQAALTEAIDHFPQLRHGYEMTELAEGDWVTVAAGEIIADGIDFPVISLAKSYSYPKGNTTRNAGAYSTPWYDPYDDDDEWNNKPADQTSGGSLLPFQGSLSQTDRKTWEASMEEAYADVEESSDASSDAEPDWNDPSFMFDVEFFHFLTQGVFIGTAVSATVIESFTELVYSAADADAVEEVFERFCRPSDPRDTQLAALAATAAKG